MIQDLMSIESIQMTIIIVNLDLYSSKMNPQTPNTT